MSMENNLFIFNVTDRKRSLNSLTENSDAPDTPSEIMKSGKQPAGFINKRTFKLGILKTVGPLGEKIVNDEISLE